MSIIEVGILFAILTCTFVSGWWLAGSSRASKISKKTPVVPSKDASLSLPKKAAEPATLPWHKVVIFEPGNDGKPLQEILGYFRGAKRSIKIATFVLSGERIAAELISAATRLVSVKIILDGQVNQLDRGSCNPFTLQQGGIATRLFQESNSAHSSTAEGRPNHSKFHRTTMSPSRIFHQKFILIDNKVLIFGSCNLSETSLATHYENFIITNDVRFVVPFREEFGISWTKFRSSC